MTCQEHCTLSNEGVEGIISQGMNYIWVWKRFIPNPKPPKKPKTTKSPLFVEELCYKTPQPGLEH